MQTIRLNGLAELRRNLQVDVPKQLRYATMQAINDTALAVQRHEVEKQLPAKLTLRSKGSPWWKPGTRYGINIRPFATRQNLRAVVGSFADWLKFQEEGGTKTGKGHRLAIEAGARPSPTAVLTPALKPRQLLRRTGDVSFTRTGKRRTVRKGGRGFILATKSGPAIFIRTGAGLKLMYMLEQSAKIPPILQFVESARVVAVRVFQGAFARRFQAALATAKTKAIGKNYG